VAGHASSPYIADGPFSFLRHLVYTGQFHFALAGDYALGYWVAQMAGKTRTRAKQGSKRSVKPSRRASPAEQHKPIFVVQKHAASRLHYDFRLEVDGVLASWAVPKGPSTDPNDKRLAVRVEDHPLDYAGFEGVIAEGEYGAGAVIVWDAGYYYMLPAEDAGGPRTMAEAIASGFVQFHLEGQKVRGGYKLVHVRLGGGEKNWLLIKKHDEHADPDRDPVATEPKSVLTGRTIEQVAAEEGGP
jgi:DNA ligase D-like protein (predicted 3'-phosphoesterase)